MRLHLYVVIDWQIDSLRNQEVLEANLGKLEMEKRLFPAFTALLDNCKF